MFLVNASGNELTYQWSKDGTIIIQTNRLYHLIQESDYEGEHVLEIDIQGTGLKAFTFTFG